MTYSGAGGSCIFGGGLDLTSQIPRRSDSDRREDCGSPIRSRTGSEEVTAEDLRGELKTKCRWGIFLRTSLFLVDLDKGFKMIFNFTGNNQKTEDFGGGKRRQEQTRFFSFGKIRPPYNRTNVLFVKGESKCTVRGR